MAKGELCYSFNVSFKIAYKGVNIKYKEEKRKKEGEVRKQPYMRKIW